MQKMTLSDWANIAQVLGIVAIVVSLVYVGLELDQNNKALQTESHRSILSMISEGENALAADPELHRIFVTGENAPDELTAEEWSRFTYFNYPRMGLWEYLYLNTTNDTVSPATWSAFDPYFRSIACLEGHRRFFEEQRVGHAPLFMSYLDREVFPNCPPRQ